MKLPRPVLLLALLPLLIAGAEEPLSKDSTAGTATKERFVEFPSDELVREREQTRQATEATLRKLKAPHEIKFVDTSLVDAMKYLADLTEVRFHIDVESLNQEGIAADTPVTIANRKPQRLSDLLDRILVPLQLGWHIEGHSVRVTTAAKLRGIIDTRAYAVGRLLQLAAEREALLPEPLPASGRPALPRGDTAAIGQLLGNALQEATSGPWEKSNGQGPRGPSVVGERMIVHQNGQNHREIAALLRTMELALVRPLGTSTLLATESEEEGLETTKLQRFLDADVEVAYVETPLVDVALDLGDQLEQEIAIDNEALTEEGIAADSPVTLHGRSPARLALRQILEPLSLGIEIRHGTLTITTLAKQKEHLQTVVYDVADLLRAGHDMFELIRVIEESTSGPFQNVDGEGGTITEFPGGLLVIRQWADVQTEVALLFHDLRQAMRDDKTPPQPSLSKLETRFHRAKSKAEAEALELLVMTFVAPTTWDSSGGSGVLRTAEDRLIIRQTKTVHEQIDRFLNEYQQAKPIGTATK